LRRAPITQELYYSLWMPPAPEPIEVTAAAG
jgi:hypothetical protein